SWARWRRHRHLPASPAPGGGLPGPSRQAPRHHLVQRAHLPARRSERHGVLRAGDHTFIWAAVCGPTVNSGSHAVVHCNLSATDVFVEAGRHINFFASRDFADGTAFASLTLAGHLEDAPVVP